MGNDYLKYLRHKQYTFDEILSHVSDLKLRFPVEKEEWKKGIVSVRLSLQPTENSVTYTVVLISRIGRRHVEIFVVNPKIEKYTKGKRTPHLYPNGSLCLYYPRDCEWDYNDDWSDTLIPWTSLWLYYYEIWLETGKWVGGGKHGKKKQEPL